MTCLKSCSKRRGPLLGRTCVVIRCSTVSSSVASGISSGSTVNSIAIFIFKGGPHAKTRKGDDDDEPTKSTERASGMEPATKTGRRADEVDGKGLGNGACDEASL